MQSPHLATLASRELIVVTGKGGVGKSAVSAALGRLLAAVGRSIGGVRNAFSVAAAPAVLASLVVFIAFGLTLRSLPGGSVDEQGRYRYGSIDETLDMRLRKRRHEAENEPPIQV